MLLATVAIVAVSLALSGALTGVLVQQLALGDAQGELAKNVLLLRPDIQQWQTSTCTSTLPRHCTPNFSEVQFLDEVRVDVQPLDPSDDRLILLLNRQRELPRARGTLHVLYDSAGTLGPDTPIPLGRETRVAGKAVQEGHASLDGHDYLVTAVGLPIGAGGGYWASWMILARSSDQVAAKASGDLAPRVLVSAAAGLLLAVAATLLLSRAFTRPLRELRSAAEDIAGGNYSRRVGTAGRDEIGVVGQAFNRMAEAVERTRAQQRAFLANVSHELKTPLTSLIGFSQALMDGSLRTDQEKLRAAAILHEEAQRVLRMSQELLDLARVEAGQLTLSPHPVDLGIQLQVEIEIVRARAQARSLTLQLAVPPGLPPVEADPDRLHQILENLLDNAVKYAPEGGTIRISAEHRDGGRIVTTVGNPVGVRVPDPDRMFDRFYRGDPSRSSAAGGVGLGLAISRELAIAQDGTLTARLDARGHLCLVLDLPVAPQPPAPRELPGRIPARLAPRPQPR